MAAIRIAYAMLPVSVPRVAPVPVIVLDQGVSRLRTKLLELLDIIHGTQSSVVPEAVLIDGPGYHADHDCCHDCPKCQLAADRRREPCSDGVHQEPAYAEEQYGENQDPREDPRNGIEHLGGPRLLPAAVDHMVVYPAVIQPILRI